MSMPPQATFRLPGKHGADPKQNGLPREPVCMGAAGNYSTSFSISSSEVWRTSLPLTM